MDEIKAVTQKNKLKVKHFFKKINRVNKPEKIYKDNQKKQFVNIRDENKDITIDLSNIEKRILRVCYKQAF